MTIDTLNQSKDKSADVHFERKHERFLITTFTENQNPLGALRAQQIQGQSYVEAGFVYESGLDQYGRLQPELDRSRGENVTYFLADSLDGTKDQGSVRVIDILENGSLEDLAAYRYSKETIDPVVEMFLRTTHEARGTGSVREVAALSKMGGEKASLSSLELIREIVQRAIRGRTNEIWVITFATSAYESILDKFGPDTMTQIGDQVSVDVGDERTSEELRLVPVMIEPCKVIDQIVTGLEKAKDLDEMKKLARTLFFMTDGLKSNEISEQAKSMQELLLEARAS